MHNSVPSSPNTAPRAVVIARPGGYDQLRVATVPLPVPARGEVRVRTRAAGVNFADCIIRMGLYESAKKYEGYPITPGFEFAGVVDALGDDVRDLAVGDAVMGVSRFRAQATHVCVPRHQLFDLPAGFTHEEAAAFPAVFLTAYYALHTLAAVHAGSTVVVHSAAGGVGGALVQLARAAGCRVIAIVGRSEKLPVARALGAHEAIARTARWDATVRAMSPGGVHAVFDANGATTLRESYALLRPTGRVVVYGFHGMLSSRDGRPSLARLAWDFLRMPRFSPLALTGENRSVMGFNLSYLFEEHALLTRAMESLLSAVARGEIRALPVTPYPLDRVADAHRALESARTTGKLVLQT